MSNELSTIPSRGSNREVLASEVSVERLETNERDTLTAAAKTPSGLLVQWLIWGGAIFVILLACCLELTDGADVVLPFISLPIPPICVVRRFFGIECPGCGLTRAFVCLAHGDLAHAWRYNVGAILLFPFVVAQIPYRILQLWRFQRRLPLWDASRFMAWGWIFVLVLVCQWLVKMVTFSLDGTTFDSN